MTTGSLHSSFFQLVLLPRAMPVLLISLLALACSNTGARTALSPMSCPDGFPLLESNGENQRGDRCLSRNSTGSGIYGEDWSCPVGCVRTGASAECSALSTTGHCLDTPLPCRVQEIVGCLEHCGRYEPLNMYGQGRTVETSAFACQQRCAGVAKCAHFSMWRDGGCHLQDATAVFMEDEFAFTGPPACGQQEPSPVAKPEAPAWLLNDSLLPLRTRGSHLVSIDGVRQVLSCVNWYGAHMEMLVNNGLNVRSIKEIAEEIVKMRFNCVRMPYSSDSLNLTAASVPNPGASLCHNPELQASSPLQIFDATLQALTDAGLLVVLNNHVSHRGWCCSMNDGDGMWYTDGFPESAWLEHLGFMAARYKDNPRVVGFDIRNEIRSTEFATPTWGHGSAEVDWAQAASKGSRQVLDANPDMLVFISGLEYSKFLCDVPSYPLHLEPGREGHIVYTTHEYDWYNSSVQNMYMVGQNLCGFFAAFVGLQLLLSLAVLVIARFTYKSKAVPGKRVRCFPRLRGSCFETLLALVATSAFLLCLLFVGQLVMNPCEAVGVALVSFTTMVVLPLWLLGLVCSVRLSCVLLGTLRPTAEPQAEKALEGPVELPECNRSGDELPEGSQKAQQRGKEHQPGFRWRAAAMAVLGMLLLIFANAAAVSYLSAYEVFEKSLNDRWGFLIHDELDAEGANVAPIWLGEFGTNKDSLWWNHLQRYLASRPMAGWAYWQLNGEKRPGETASFGLLKDDMRTVRHPWKLLDIQELQATHAKKFQ